MGTSHGDVAGAGITHPDGRPAGRFEKGWGHFTVGGTCGRTPAHCGELDRPSRTAANALDAVHLQMGSKRLAKVRKPMKPSTRNQAKGKLENLKGRIKEIAGIVTGRGKLEAEGKNQALAGRARKKLGHVEKVVGK
jgi:uncharacterized protein YjbJ (UPF0337 family)